MIGIPSRPSLVDCHVHQPTAVGTWGYRGYTAAEYVETMDNLGVSVSVIFTLDGLFDPTAGRNDDLAAYVSACRHRMAPLATVNPRRSDAAREVERCLGELAMHGLKFHPWLQGFSPLESFMDRICEVAASYARPVLFHDGTPPYSTPMQVAELARRHPTVPIVLGHGGLTDLWREAMVAVTETDNLYVCMCGPPPSAMREIVKECPIDRILVGTDAGLASSPVQPYVKTRLRILRELDLSPIDRTAIFEANARRLFGLPTQEDPVP